MHFKGRAQLFSGVLTALLLGLTSSFVLAADTASQNKFAIEMQTLYEEVLKAKVARDYSAKNACSCRS